MSKILILRGLPASGKSTFAKKLQAKDPGKWKRINKDDLRAMMDDGFWSKENEEFVLECRDFLVTTALLNNFDVIVDDTNFSPKHEASLRNMVDLMNGTGNIKMSPEMHIEMEIKDFTDVSPEICIERDSKRTNPVGEKVIMDMYNKYIK